MPPLTLKISASGVRGVVGQSLTPQLVASFAAAFGNYCAIAAGAGEGAVLVATDGRVSSEMIRQAVLAGLLSVGAAPVDLGVVPLPALMWYVRATGARGAVNIGGPRGAQGFREGARAPTPWSRLRFIGGDGSALRANQAAELTDLFHQGVYSRVPADRIPAVTADDRAVERHRAAVLAAVDGEAIRARRFVVALDPGEGPCALASPPLLQALGCQVVSAAPDQLAQAVRQRRAQVGFLQDADGDRLGLVDETGEPLVEDATVALAIEHWLQRDPGPVVVSVSTSRAIEEIAARASLPVSRTPVGEAQVTDRMRALGASIGGEGDGGVILAPVNPCRDSFVAMALLLESMARDPSPLSARAAPLRRRRILRESLLCPPREVAPALRWLRHVYRERTFDSTDGLGISWGDRWLHVRPSHSEPLLRLTVEAPPGEADQLLAELIAHLSPEG